MRLGINRHKRLKKLDAVIPQIAVPPEYRLPLIESYHNQLMHSGIDKTFLTIKQNITGSHSGQMLPNLSKHVSFVKLVKQFHISASHPCTAGSLLTYSIGCMSTILDPFFSRTKIRRAKRSKTRTNIS